MRQNGLITNFNMKHELGSIIHTVQRKRDYLHNKHACDAVPVKTNPNTVVSRPITIGQRLNSGLQKKIGKSTTCTSDSHSKLQCHSLCYQ